MEIKTDAAQIERRMLGDVSTGLVAVIILTCVAYLLDLAGAVAEWTGRPEIAEIDNAVLILVFAVWIIGIVLLRRVQDLRRIASERNVVARRAYETQKMESLARMASGLAHDFNNLLMAMLGFCDLAMKRPEIDDALREDLAEIRHAGNKASSLVQRLLAFARRKKMDAEPPEILNLNCVIADMEPMLKHLLGKMVTMEMRLEASHSLVLASLTQVEEILVNLALNAHDAMSESGTFTIGTAIVTIDKQAAAEHPGVRAGDFVEMSFTDTGIGIPPETRERILDPFFSTKEKGTGLGLAMVAGIVEQSLGIIEVDSTVGTGTTFRVLLPCASEPENEPATE